MLLYGDISLQVPAAVHTCINQANSWKVKSVVGCGRLLTFSLFLLNFCTQPAIQNLEKREIRVRRGQCSGNKLT